ncbi:MAG: LytTR family transcriptional regulator [Clostridia bacterium]|nr:LytTR family transcriptional regulator [Clostridia bacterium]
MYQEVDSNAVFAFKRNGTKVEIYCSDIVFFESYGHYITIHMKDKSTYIMRGTLHAIDRELNGKGFVRIHRGFTVNLSYVKKIERTSVFLDSEWGSVPVSRSRKESLIAILREYGEI